ncbi:MAG TPA: hypothetical protein VND62_07965 [Acidimicrobiales bacterium]|nr:hypothetical protein [Acidimicrobiales bacterium]
MHEVARRVEAALRAVREAPPPAGRVAVFPTTSGAAVGDVRVEADVAPGGSGAQLA